MNLVCEYRHAAQGREGTEKRDTLLLEPPVHINLLPAVNLNTNEGAGEILNCRHHEIQRNLTDGPAVYRAQHPDGKPIVEQYAEGQQHP